jgi:hypothetical protein
MHTNVLGLTVEQRQEGIFLGRASIPLWVHARLNGDESVETEVIWLRRERPTIPPKAAVEAELTRFICQFKPKPRQLEDYVTHDEPDFEAQISHGATSARGREISLSSVHFRLAQM